jgi:hypothetical protein
MSPKKTTPEKKARKARGPNVPPREKLLAKLDKIHGDIGKLTEPRYESAGIVPRLTAVMETLVIAAKSIPADWTGKKARVVKAPTAEQIEKLAERARVAQEKLDAARAAMGEAGE